MKTESRVPRARLLGLLLAMATLGLLVWYLFRPELLVIDKTVDEPFPERVESLALQPPR